MSSWPPTPRWQKGQTACHLQAHPHVCQRGRSPHGLQRPGHRPPLPHSGAPDAGGGRRKLHPRGATPPPAASSSTRTSLRIWALWTAAIPSISATTKITFTCGKKQLGQIVDRTINKHGFTVASEVLDAIKSTGYHNSTIAAITVSIADMTIPPKKYELVHQLRADGGGHRKPVQDGLHDRPRALQAGGAGLGKDHRRGFHRPAGEPGPLQPHLHDGGLRRPWLHEADPPAGRYARPDRKHRRPHHRDPHQGQLPRGPDRSGILHLQPRRPKGPGRYRSAYRRLRLSDPPHGGRLSGRHHPGAGLRRHPRHQGFPHQRERAGH